MSRYAANTSVSVDQSRAHIEKTLRRYGANGFMYGWEGTRAVVGFRMNGRQIKFEIQMPDRQDPEFTMTPAGRERSHTQADSAWEQAGRQRWRALELVIKAKLEAVESGITEFDTEFLAHIVLPDGRTAGEWAVPQVAAAYESGAMPQKLLPPASGS